MQEGLSRREFLLGTAAAGAAAVLVSCAAPIERTAGVKKRRPGPVVISTWRHGVAANAAAWAILEKGGTAIDAVEAGVRVPEGDPEVTSVGYGGAPNCEGVVELDACIMRGEDRECGAVGGLQKIKHPISVARKVLEETRHVMLVGDNARRFAVDQGFREEDLLTDKSRARWEKWKAKGGECEGHDTIGMVALDAAGNLAGACTTSGLAYKLPGRVGDSPIIGAGMYADNRGGAAAATGVGEEVIKTCGSFLIVEAMRHGKSAQEACEIAVQRILEGGEAKRKISVSYLAVSLSGEIGAASIRQGFQYAVRTADRDGLVDVAPAVPPEPGPEPKPEREEKK